MPRRAAAVTQADIARAIRALRDAGAPVDRVRVRLGEGGSVIVEVGEKHATGPTWRDLTLPDDERRVIAL